MSLNLTHQHELFHDSCGKELQLLKALNSRDDVVQDLRLRRKSHILGQVEHCGTLVGEQYGRPYHMFLSFALKLPVDVSDNISFHTHGYAQDAHDATFEYALIIFHDQEDGVYAYIPFDILFGQHLVSDELKSSLYVFDNTFAALLIHLQSFESYIPLKEDGLYII